MSGKTTVLYNVGDIILGPDPDFYFTEVSGVLAGADMVAGQLEVTHTARNPQALRLGRDPEHLRPLAANGFDLVTMAGNHLMDAGREGVEDTVAWLDRHGIRHVGAGMNIREARQPAVIEKNGVTIGYLNYNCVGPKRTWAGEDRPGCAYLNIITHYELEHETPGGPPTIYSWADMDSLKAMEADIRALRPQCDVLVVAFHKGIGHTPAAIAQYERQVSHAAIDAGADLVVAHHAHILRGVEMYKGKAVYHGLCNFVTWAPYLSPSADPNPDSWVRRRIEIFGFEPLPNYPTYPFHPEAIYTMIAKTVIRDRRIVQNRFLPCVIQPDGRPKVFGRSPEGQRVVDYVKQITRKAKLNSVYQWDGDEVVILPAEGTQSG